MNEIRITPSGSGATYWFHVASDSHSAVIGYCTPVRRRPGTTYLIYEDNTVIGVGDDICDLPYTQVLQAIHDEMKEIAK